MPLLKPEYPIIEQTLRDDRTNPITSGDIERQKSGLEVHRRWRGWTLREQQG